MVSTDGTAVLVEISNRLSTLETGMTEASNVASRVAQIDFRQQEM